MKNFGKSPFELLAIITAVGVIFGAGFSALNSSQSTNESRPQVRELDTNELSILSAKGLKGNCISAYQVGLHHLYFSLDDHLAVTFFRIAAKCKNPDAYASLITLLAGRQEFDEEVDQALTTLAKIDPELAKRAETEIGLRRDERLRSR
ncbi:hypothetical protein [Massilia soli]|uniref:Uncharacterized protein n=1 Tax=Massilia soli TaxID=2792854 RepID=A0ABS7SJS6_9BURK|nr:hypothetical protein [Massilia soli]MBZ2206369.1 hypothetical protein [Massilia soli]